MGQSLDEVGERGVMDGCLEIGLGCIRSTDEDVGPKSVVEEVGVLGNQRDSPTEVVESVVCLLYTSDAADE